MKADKLTEDERLALFREMRQSADPQKSPARERLILSGMTIVESVISRVMYRHKAIASAWRDDAVSRGTETLIRMIDRFDPDRGTRFVPFAYISIRQDVNRFLVRSRSALNLPDSAAEGVLLCWAGRPGRKKDVRTVPAALAALRTPDRVGTSTLSGEFDPVARPHDGPEPDAYDRLMSAIQSLTPRQREAVSMRYGMFGCESATFRELAARSGILKNSFFVNHKRAIRNLQAAMGGTHAA